MRRQTEINFFSRLTAAVFLFVTAIKKRKPQKNFCKLIFVPDFRVKMVFFGQKLKIKLFLQCYFQIFAIDFSDEKLYYYGILISLRRRS